VDLVVEVGGAGTLEKSVKATKHGGLIALVGVLAGGTGFNPLAAMMKGITIRGIFVGSQAMFQEMLQHMNTHHITPVVDRVFDFSKAVQALEYLESGTHMGKVVIQTDI
jgi:NADPH:quinone reductase-like Zn-dependent oxidoreductase